MIQLVYSLSTHFWFPIACALLKVLLNNINNIRKSYPKRNALVYEVTAAMYFPSMK